MATVALLHGFAATNFTWRDVEGPLRDAGHDVVALERPFVPLRAAVEVTAGALNALGWNEVMLVGHSAGAELAAHLAARDPSAVRGLVLCAPVIGGGPPPIARAIAGAPVVRDVAPALLRVAVRVGLDRALRQTWVNKDRVTSEVVEGFRAPLLRPGVAESMCAMTAAHGTVPLDWHALADTPTLVVLGDSDRWAKAPPLAHAQVVTYERCGHLPHEECADRFVRDVLRFVATLA